MKTFITNFLKYVFLLSLFYFPLSWIFGEINLHVKSNIRKRAIYGHLRNRLEEIGNYNNVDILFLGSSHVYRGFDNRIFLKNGIKTFTLGSSGQTPRQAEIFVSRYIGKLNPKLVILEANPSAFGSDGVESMYDLIINSKIDSSIIKSVFSYCNWGLINTLFFHLYKKNIKKDFSILPYTHYEKLYLDNNLYVRGGFVEKKISYNQPKNYERNDILFLDKQFRSFENITNILKEKKIEFLIVRTPVTQSYQKSIKNIDTLSMWLKEIGEYVDFNDLIDMNDSLHFYDGHHMNMNGVAVFNEVFIEFINKRKSKDQK